MTPEQKQRIIEIIKHNANERGQFVNDTGTRYCVIGGLLKAAGLSDRKIHYSLGRDSVLREEYGLEEQSTDTLMDINDRYALVGARRKALIAYVRSLPTVPA